MKTAILTVALLTALSLPACADGEPASEQPSCEFPHLIGKKDTEIDRSQFGDRVVRSLKPGQMVTMEYLEGRINLQVDDAGVITAVTCG